MANLAIPEAIANNASLSPEAKLAFSQLFSHLKKGERPSVQLKDVGMSIALGGASLLDALRSLNENGYAFLDETQDALENLIPGQECRISPRVHIQVLPHLDDSEDAQNIRRYADADKPSWDETKIGRTVYRANLARFMNEWTLGVRRWVYPRGCQDLSDREETVIVDGQSFATQRKAWDWFDGFIAQEAAEYRGILVESDDRLVAMPEPVPSTTDESAPMPDPVPPEATLPDDEDPFDDGADPESEEEF